MRFQVAMTPPVIPEGVVLGARKPRKLPPGGPVAVVIPSHNYARYLGECLDSVLSQTLTPSKILVIDDASDDNPAAVAASRGVECRRVEHRNVHQVRRDGLAAIADAKYALFLDADNRLPPDYLAGAVATLEADRSIAFCYPSLQRFGDRTDLWEMPPAIVAADIEARNVCDAGTVWRAAPLRQALALAVLVPPECPAADWRMARAVLRSGPWRAARAPVPLHYRTHATQMIRRAPPDYFRDADLANESITMVLALSGRDGQWPRRLEWLRSQTWPADHLHLQIWDNAHRGPRLGELGVADWPGGVTYRTVPYGRAGLADEGRRAAPEVHRGVQETVAAIYNRAPLAAEGEFLLFVEDDVHPHAPDAIARLLRRMAPDVACVTGAYPQRGAPRHAVAFTRVGGYAEYSLAALDYDGLIVGSGFGFLLARRSVLLRLPLAADHQPRPHYDVDASGRVQELGLRWLLAADVRCDHDVPQPVKPPPVPLRNPALCLHASPVHGCTTCAGVAVEAWACDKLNTRTDARRCGACRPPLFEPA